MQCSGRTFGVLLFFNLLNLLWLVTLLLVLLASKIRDDGMTKNSQNNTSDQNLTKLMTVLSPSLYNICIILYHWKVAISNQHDLFFNLRGKSDSQCCQVVYMTCRYHWIVQISKANCILNVDFQSCSHKGEEEIIVYQLSLGDFFSVCALRDVCLPEIVWKGSYRTRGWRVIW